FEQAELFAGLGTPILIGREEVVQARIEELGLLEAADVEVHNASLATDREKYIEFLYERMQRQGSLFRDCQRWVNQNRNVFASCMIAHGAADAMITGLTRRFSTCFRDISRVLDPMPGQQVFGLTIHTTSNHTLFVADTSVHERPTPEVMVEIAKQSAAKARQMGHEPRIAFLSYSNFGNPPVDYTERSREAVRLLDEAGGADFEYDGEMTADTALDPVLRERFYPFSRLSGPANVLIMPGLHSAHIVSRLLQSLEIGTVVGPLLMGLEKPVEIAQMRSTVNDLVNAAALAAHESIRLQSVQRGGKHDRSDKAAAAQ
ncbi:MAG: phosphate acyltransferase, partial [Alphaproteobacteria bacterium]|nr:phosphate acyltransferase [Alphaproteobacteria bacterium]